jgi:UDP-N-acetylglucosamine 2-epimerase (non-hydrolysing)
LTVIGTRPEIIRLSCVIKNLDASCEHTIVHTGQNFQPNLSDIFFEELEVRRPDRYLGIRGKTFGEQVGELFSKIDAVFEEVRPDRVLILGDTNSALSSIVAARRRIPVFHMEAGNRCYDDRVPEEINRRIIDHSSTILMPYTERSKENLIGEGIGRDRIFITGNPIFEVLNRFRSMIDAANSPVNLSVDPRKYFLATLHRAENVDDPIRLQEIFDTFSVIAKEYSIPIIVSVHPRTAEKLSQLGVSYEEASVRLFEALPFFCFVKLEKNAFMVLTDSGTVQEECAIFGVPNVTLRDVTERPETVECGSNVIGGSSKESILRAVRIASTNAHKWKAPNGYLAENVSQTVSNIVLGNLSLREHH